MEGRVVDAVRRMLREDPKIRVQYDSAIRPDSSHRGDGVLSLHPSLERVVLEARANTPDQTNAAHRVPNLCALCGHEPVGLRLSAPRRFLRWATRRKGSAASCASFEYDETPSMRRDFCPCSGPAHQTQLVSEWDGIELNPSCW